MTAAIETVCFHCGEALDGGRYPIEFEGSERATCCPGCQAVARTIIEGGLSEYYRARATPAAKPAPSSVGAAQLEIYDAPEVQRSFVHTDPHAPGMREAAVLLDGVTCAACVWLIEKRLAAFPGVVGFVANASQRRARIRWDEGSTRLSAILAEVRSLGYDAQPYDAARAGAALESERRGLLWRLFVAGMGMMQVMMYAVPVYLAEGGMTADVERLMQIAGLILTAPVVAWAATPFYRGAIRELRRRRLGMNIPIALAVLSAFAASAAATLLGSGQAYFDSITMFVFLLLLARHLELSARLKAADAQTRLARLAPANAERLDGYPESGEPVEIPAAALRVGDVVLVRAGAVVPADGEVIEGRSATDESLLTGESRSVWKAPGDAVICGAVNKHASLVVRVQRVGEDSAISGIVRLMDRAQGERPRIGRLADRAAAVFVAMVLALTALAVAGWLLVDPARAFWIAVALLVVSCPCALSLATPAALTAASGLLYRRGVLLTRGRALETLARATHFVFDKTGTLTSREQRLVGVIPIAADASRCHLSVAAALEAQSEHRIARAIVEANGGCDGFTVCERASEVGKGVEGRIDGIRYRLGTLDYVAALHGRPRPVALSFVADEVGVVALGNEHGWLALLTFAETLRPDARHLIRALHGLGAKVCLLSGDRHERAALVAAELGIDTLRTQATPADKVDFVKALQAQGAVVAMVGDGVNDAPVLSQAQVSIALASGADLAQCHADIVLVGSRLGGLLTAVLHARRTLAIVRENLVWATVYNAIALPLAALGWITPLAAAAGMSLSSLLVVANALRLLREPAAARSVAARPRGPRPIVAA